MLLLTSVAVNSSSNVLYVTSFFLEQIRLLEHLLLIACIFFGRVTVK